MEALEPEAATPARTWVSRLVEVIQPVGARIDRLRSVSVFATLSRAELEFAASILREVLVERGTRMTVQGLKAGRAWLILEGQALVSKDARPIRVAGHGDVIGLSVSRPGSASPVTTIALSPIRAFEADIEDFSQLLVSASILTRMAATGMARGG